jgi:Sigma-70, region 4
VRTWRRWRLVRKPDNPEAYARKVLVNRHRSLLRRALVEARYLYRDRPNEGYSDEHREDAIVLWAATRRLPLRQRAVLVLRYYEDLSEAEIARVLDIPVGTVKTLGPPGPGQASPQPGRHHPGPGPQARQQGAIMRLEEQLQDAYQRAAQLAPVPPGAYDRFLRCRARHGRVVAAAAGLALVAVLGAAVLVARQLPQARALAAPTANAAELANRAATAAAAQSIPTPSPHQWVYTKELRVEYGGHKPWTQEHWVRVDGKQYANAFNNDLRAARVSEASTEQRASALWPRCPPGKRQQLARVRPAVGLAAFFPNPAAVPTDPDGLLAAVYQLVQDPACAPILVGDTVQDRAFMLIDAMLQTVQPAEVRAGLYRALARIPGVTVVPGVTDAAGRRGVALARAAAIEGPGSAGWLRLEIILDRDSYRYLGARHVVTRDHFTPNVGPGSKGTWFREGQVLVSRAQLALAVVNAPCQRPGETTTCAS